MEIKNKLFLVFSIQQMGILAVNYLKTLTLFAEISYSAVFSGRSTIFIC